MNVHLFVLLQYIVPLPIPTFVWCRLLRMFQYADSFYFIFIFYLFLPLHTGSCRPIYGRAPAPPQGYRRCAGAYPTPVYHSWRAHSEDRETLGIEPGTSRSPDERSTN